MGACVSKECVCGMTFESARSLRLHRRHCYVVNEDELSELAYHIIADLYEEAPFPPSCDNVSMIVHELDAYCIVERPEAVREAVWSLVEDPTRPDPGRVRLEWWDVVAVIERVTGSD